MECVSGVVRSGLVRDAEQLVQRLGLSSRIHALPSTFSRGLSQKTAIAIARCRPFSILLVDKPISGLDRAGRASRIELVTEIKNQRDLWWLPPTMTEHSLWSAEPRC